VPQLNGWQKLADPNVGSSNLLLCIPWTRKMLIRCSAHQVSIIPGLSREREGVKVLEALRSKGSTEAWI